MKGLRLGLSLVGSSLVPIPWTAGANVSVVDEGGNQYLVTKTAGGDAYNAVAYTDPINADFRLYALTSQSNAAIILGLSADTTTNTATIEGTIFYGTGSQESIAGGVATGGTAPNTPPTHTWIERIGTETKMYHHTSDDRPSATLFHTFPGDTSDTDILKAIIYHQGASIRLRVELL